MRFVAVTYVASLDTRISPHAILAEGVASRRGAPPYQENWGLDTGFRES
jgi:hypothetical protein